MTLIRTLLTAVALVAAAAVPASASTDFQYAGACGYDAMTNPAGADPDRFHGALYGYAAVYSPSAPDLPVSATLTCTLAFEDGSSYVASFSGTRFLYGSEPITFTADHPFDQWEFCETIDFHDDGEPPRTACYAFTMEQIPPQELYDGIDGVLALVPGSKDALCAAVRAVEPFVPDLWLTLLVTDEGDVFVGKHHVWHCT